MKHLLSAILSISLCVFIPTSKATIVDNGIYTTDSITKLDWLDLTETVSLSYNYVTSQFGTGGIYNGFRYATATEFTQLVYNATGASLDGFKVTMIPKELTEPLINLLGSTYHSTAAAYGYTPHSYRDFTGGILSNIDQDGNHLAGRIGWDDKNPLTFNSAQVLNRTTFDGWSHGPGIGSYLVRPVPVPAAIWLMGSGLLGLIGYSRKIKSDFVAV